MLADERGSRLLDPRLFGDHLGLRAVEAGLQVFRVEPGQHLPGGHAITDIHHALDDLAVHAKRQLGLDPRLNIPGEGHRGCEFSGFYLLHEHPWAFLFNGLLVAARGQQGKEAQANDTLQSGTSHASSFA
ncbi:hypothetical protein D3C78_730920 [compost metagenome]